MFIPSETPLLGQDANASTVSSASPLTLSAAAPPIPREQVRHMLFGSPAAVQSDIRHMHKLGYAEANDWSRLISTGRANEVMAILTKKVEVT